jgi:hypothetical protein
MLKPNLFNISPFVMIVFVLGILTGCVNTEETLQIEGRVSDESTKEGIPWKSVIVQGLVNTNNISVPIEVGQFSTDSLGHFKYSFRKIKEAKNYNFCLAGDSEYLFTINSITLFDLKKNARFLSFSLNKLVDLTIKLNRISKTPVRDTVRLCWYSDGVYGGALYHYKIINNGRTNNSITLSSDMDLMWVGGYVNSSINTKVFADKKTRLFWELFRYGKRMEFVDTITCRRDYANIVSFTY